MPNEIASRARHARADSVVDVAHDDGVDERNRAEHRRHEQRARREEQPPVRVRGRTHQHDLQRDDREQQPLHRHAVDQMADDELRERGDRVDEREQHAERERMGGDRRHPLAQQLGVAVGREGEDQRAGRRGDRDDREHARHQTGRKGRFRRPALRRRQFLAGGHPSEHDAAADRQQPGNDERHAPAEVLGQRAGRDRRDRDTEIARQPVDADRASRARGIAHQHRDADRVIDRRERAHHRQSDRDLPRPGRCRDQQQRGAQA